MSMPAPAPNPASTSVSAASIGMIGLLWRGLCLVALGCMIAAYFAPAWWVALKAPNYPEHTFPVGIRIHFHMDGVRNGCVVRTSQEVTEKEALDCVHEMDTINHFVGMYPIASGGPVEKVFSPFLMSFMGVLVLGFVLPGARLRLLVMGTGFAVIAAWMSVALFTNNGSAYLAKGYVHALITSLGADDENGAQENLHPIVRQLRESLAKSGIATDARHKAGEGSSKDELLETLRNAYEQDGPRGVASAQGPWTGSAMQLFAWHYDKSLNRWFNQPDKNDRLVRIMTSVAYVVYAGVLAAMLAFLWLARRSGSKLFWSLVLVPMVLPVAFLAEYAGWLWWYGHTLNSMGAFTLKPFMPTVFGQGKVAQFITLSYPHIGFGLMCVSGLLLAVAALMRRRDGLRDQ